MRGPRGASGSDRSFARFYLEKVAISEGCGCNELVIKRRLPALSSGGLLAALRQRWRRLWRRSTA